MSVIILSFGLAISLNAKILLNSDVDSPEFWHSRVTDMAECDLGLLLTQLSHDLALPGAMEWSISWSIATVLGRPG